MISGKEDIEYLLTSKYSTLITSSNNMPEIVTNAIYSNIFRNYEKIFIMILKNNNKKQPVLHNVNAHLDINNTAKFSLYFLTFRSYRH